MFTFLNDMGNYESRKVAKDESHGLMLSTAYTSDEGYETAIGDADGDWHPVQRYRTKDEAVIGHANWLAKLPTLTTVNKLGWQGIIEDKEITLKRA